MAQSVNAFDLSQVILGWEVFGSSLTRGRLFLDRPPPRGWQQLGSVRPVAGYTLSRPASAAVGSRAWSAFKLTLRSGGASRGLGLALRHRSSPLIHRGREIGIVPGVPQRHLGSLIASVWSRLSRKGAENRNLCHCTGVCVATCNCMIVCNTNRKSPGRATKIFKKRPVHVKSKPVFLSALTSVPCI